jgi:hypothetical protein
LKANGDLEGNTNLVLIESEPNKAFPVGTSKFSVKTLVLICDCTRFDSKANNNKSVIFFIYSKIKLIIEEQYNSCKNTDLEDVRECLAFNFNKMYSLTASFVKILVLICVSSLC